MHQTRVMSINGTHVTCASRARVYMSLEELRLHHVSDLCLVGQNVVCRPLSHRLSKCCFYALGRGGEQVLCANLMCRSVFALKGTGESDQ